MVLTCIMQLFIPVYPMDFHIFSHDYSLFIQFKPHKPDFPYNPLREKYMCLPKKVEYNKHRSSKKGTYYKSCHSRDAETTC